MKGFMAAAALALLHNSIPAVEAKEHYVVKETAESHQHKRPHVESSQEKCAYDTLSFKVCGTYGASVKAGWEWEQEYNDLIEDDSYYFLKLNLFSEQGLDVEGLFSADRLYEIKPEIILDDFKAQGTFQLKRWYSSGKTCIAVYSSIEDLVFEFIIRQKFVEVSKNVVEHFWTFDNWDGPWAKWFDEIALSNTIPVYILNRQYQSAADQSVLVGTLDEDGPNCIPGVIQVPWATYNSGFNQYLNNTIDKGINYMVHKYGANTSASGRFW